MPRCPIERAILTVVEVACLARKKVADLHMYPRNLVEAPAGMLSRWSLFGRLWFQSSRAHSIDTHPHFFSHSIYAARVPTHILQSAITASAYYRRSAIARSGRMSPIRRSASGLELSEVPITLINPCDLRYGMDVAFADEYRIQRIVRTGASGLVGDRSPQEPAVRRYSCRALDAESGSSPCSQYYSLGLVRRPLIPAFLPRRDLAEGTYCHSSRTVQAPSVSFRHSM